MVKLSGFNKLQLSLFLGFFSTFWFILQIFSGRDETRLKKKIRTILGISRKKA
jgi:hypothetical protein